MLARAGLQLANVVLPDENNGRGLRPFFALALLGDIADFIADGQLPECAIGDTILVEIDLETFR